MTPSGGPILVAVSGGPDSMALAALLAQGRHRGGIAWIHLNHQLRGAASDTDEAFVRAQARRFGVRCYVRREDVERFAKERKMSLEEAGRACRYRFFEEIARKHWFRAVATGHTADDQAVTVLARLLRGTGLRGLRGIPAARPIRPGSEIQVIRPLLGWSRARVIAYLARRKVPFRVDATNDDPRFERNRLRAWIEARARSGSAAGKRDLVPTLLRIAELARQAYDPLEREILRILPRIVSSSRMDAPASAGSGVSLSIDRESFRMLPDPIRPELLRLAAEQGEWGGEPGSVHLDALDRLLMRGRTGQSADWPGGKRWILEYGRALLRGRPVAGAAVAEPPALLEIKRPGLYPWGNWIFRVNASASFPLTIRSRRPGDRIRLPGGSRKLSDLFIDRKIPRGDRDRTPIVCMAAQPVWIPGIAGVQPHGIAANLITKRER